MTYCISVDSACDLDRQYIEENNLKHIGYHYILGEDEKIDDFEGPSLDEYYTELKSGKLAKTAAINTAELIDHLEPLLKEGLDVIHFTLSSGLSSTYQNALMAKEILDERYPDRKLYIVDSLNATSPMGLLIDKMVDLKKEGKSIDYLRDYAEKYRTYIYPYFTTTDLTHLIHGGRISAPAGLIGNILNICPIMIIKRDGSLNVEKKIRSKKKAYSFMLKKYEDLADFSEKAIVSHTMMPEDAEKFKEKLLEINPDLKDKVYFWRVGPTIGGHLGPDSMIITFWSKIERS